MNRRAFVVRSGCTVIGAPIYSRIASILGHITVEPATQVFPWERGIAVESRGEKGMAVFLWIYEWTMFGAVNSGEHTLGAFEPFQRSANPAQTEATAVDDEFRMTLKASETGADLFLEVTNKSDHDWPDLASIIPCLSPGLTGGNLNERHGVAEGLLPPRNPAFANEKTFFLGPAGLELLHGREIHFNTQFRPQLDAASPNGGFSWSQKWPTAKPDAAGGIIMRESTDGVWVAGIAWDAFLSVQAHNPWRCMHLAVHVGPLKRNESKKIRGKLYLLKGTKEDCLRLYRADFP
ncbi:MAG TPA: hypothetical protein VE967_09175 [Gemmatimonadaceae bacterium]|nr:hypothetical protein [Gemmatimonadaceae bacterium]